MNTKRNRAASRRGSALLIVLGMLAFMIISAVAFSAYMRFSRMPSSFLRRTSASRLLVKAALARAIDEVDASIGDNPHPGVGTARTRYPRNTERDEGEVDEYGPLERNIWLHRVFFGSLHDQQYGNKRSEISNGPDGIKDSTVSPLSLEALAYIPPPLVNEARYYSRRSPAAEWKSLGFDSGRYAFCALDVSDYFDINRMTAAFPRSSAGNRRVSLGYIFENGENHTSSGSGASAWDTWMNNYRQINDEDSTFEWDETHAPLVSIADFNLALYDKGSGTGLKSPFAEFLERSDGSRFYDAAAGGGDAGMDKINRMTFVTDGLFPTEDESKIASNDDKPFELSDGEHQPFQIDPNGGNQPSITDLLMGGAHRHEAEMGWHKRLGGVGLAALYDYLDPDHVPISLALPTTERAPMICGIQPAINGATLKVVKAPDPAYDENHGDQSASAAGAAGSTRQCKMLIHYRIDPNALNLMGGAVNAVFAYPFSKNTEYSDKFKIDGRLSYFFSTEQMSLRTGNNNPNNEVLHIRDRGDLSSGVDDATGLMNIAFMPTDLTFDTKNAPEDEEKAVKDITLPFISGAPELGLRLNGERKFLSVTYKWTQRYTTEWGATEGGVRKPSWGPVFSAAANDAAAGLTVDTCTSDLCIVNKSGIRETNLKKLIDEARTIYLNVAVWLRIKNKEGKVVDMVPACLGDDTIQNPSGGGPNGFDMLNGGEFGQYYPLMRFDTAGKESCASITLSIDELDKLADGTTQPSQINLWPQSAIVADPRFNHAPENWFSMDTALSINSWLDNNHTGDAGRDGDIFMEVSDNGYLQSKYELAMLPACATLRNEGNPTGLGSMRLFTTYNGRSIPSDFGSTVQGNFMWKTYDPLGDQADEFYDIKWVGDKKGYRVCPYSDSTNVIMAAFANTPLNWACAGTNDVDDAVNFTYSDPESPRGADFNKKYAWNEYSSGGKFAWQDLTAVAGKFIDKVREKGSNWEEAWDDLGWYDDSGETFCGVSLSGNTDPLWNVDRKFFYGFWKECFAAKQQLFLIFVRAEPAMMGGGGTGQTPPQLGARAVALVWRNPAAPNSSSGGSTSTSSATPPHQTRVLFYRQLD